MEETHTILVVEDEATLREALVYNLNKEGYAVSQASTGLQALALARTPAPDVIILDLMLPELDGLSVCRSLRREPATADCSILILTARGGELDKIIGLETGADDYLTKPFSLGELLARVRALLRRTRSSAPRDTLEAGNLVLDLIAKEFSLLAELMRHRGAVLSRDLLLSHVWGQDFFGDDRTVDVHVRWLREKIEDDPAHPVHIQTVRGLGYRFEA